METEETMEEFRIDCEKNANWLLQKYATLDAEKSRIKAQAEKRLKELDTDRQGLDYRFGSELEHWTRGELEKSGNHRKSLTLLQGTCAFRSLPAGVKIVDAGELLRYAEANGREDLLKIEMQVNTEAAKAYVEETGDLLPGMDTVPARESFSIKFGKPEKE